MFSNQEEIENQFPIKDKIYPSLSFEKAAKIYAAVDSNLNNDEDEYRSVNRAYFNYFKMQPWDEELLSIIEEGLGKTRFNFLQEEFTDLKNKNIKISKDPIEKENLFLISPERCMIYYIHNKDKLKKRFLKMEKMRKQIYDYILNTTEEYKENPSYNIQTVYDAKPYQNNFKLNNNNFYGKHKRNNYKTVLCWYYEKGYCKNGNNCNFAHGNNELQNLNTPNRFEELNSIGNDANLKKKFDRSGNFMKDFYDDKFNTNDYFLNEYGYDYSNENSYTYGDSYSYEYSYSYEDSYNNLYKDEDTYTSSDYDD